MATEEILIDVKIEGANSIDDLAKKAVSLRKGIEEVKKENKELKEQLKEGTISQEQYSVAFAANEKILKEFNASLKATNGALQAVTLDNENLGDSLIEQRALLSQLKTEYASLTKAERESAAGEELRNKLLNLNTEVKEVEASFGDFQRNVGNYPQTVTAIIPGFDKFEGALSKIGLNFQTLASGGASAFKSIGQAALNFGKIMITPPVGIIVAILGAILLVINKVSDAFKKNRDATDALENAFSAFKPIAELLSKIFETLANIVAKVIAGFVGLVSAVLSLVPGYEEAADAALQLVKAQQDLDEAENNYTVNSAKRNAESAELRAKAREDDKYTYEQRKLFLQRALDNEKSNLADELAIAKERLRIIEENAKQERDTSEATEKKIAAARAAMYQANEKYFLGTKRLIAEQQALENEETKRVDDAAKKAADAAKAAAERAKQIRENLFKLQRDIETRSLELMEDNVKKVIALRQKQGDNEIQDLKRVTATTAAERAKIQELIRLSELQTQQDIRRITEEFRNERLRAEFEAETERINLELSAAVQGSNEYFDLRKKANKRLQEEELRAAQETGEKLLYLQEQIDVEKNNIREKYRQIDENIELDRIAQNFAIQQQLLRNNFEIRRQELENETVELAELALEQAQAEADALLEMDEATKAALFNNQAEYEAAVLASNQRVKDSAKAVLTAQNQMAEQQQALFNAVTSAMSQMFTELAGDNKEFAVFQKTLALAQASVELGLAIASATASATAGDPYTIAIRIIAAVAAVTASFVSVIKSIKAAQIPNPPAFAGGGIVPGTSYSGDKVNAMLNSREMVLNLEQQERLFKIANGRISQENINFQLFADAVVAAISEMPAPLLDYTEFTDFQKNTTTYKEFTKL